MISISNALRVERKGLCIQSIQRVVDERPQFDWRPEADNSWTDEREMRKKWKAVYTDAWVRLQEKYNSNWDAKLA